MKKLALITLVLACHHFAVHAQKKVIRKIDEFVKQSKIEGHIGFLASDELRGRNTATLENEIAARYLAEQFRSMGVKTVEGKDTYFQPVRLIQQKIPRMARMTIGDSTFHLWQDLIFLSSVSGEVSGELIFVNYGFEEDIKGLDLQGKIVISIAGTGNPDDGVYKYSFKKMELIRKAGALALIELYRPNRYPWSLLVNYLSGDMFQIDEGASDEPFNLAWMVDSNSTLLGFMKDQVGKPATITISGAAQNSVIVPNVIGYVEGTDPEMKDQYIIISAHFDHVGVKPVVEGDSIWNGARDNGIGTANMLTAAEYFSKNPAKRSILFLGCNAEEVGLLGSRWYADHPWVPLEQTVFNLNTDNGGYNDISKVTIVGFNRTTATPELAASTKPFGLEAMDDPIPEENFYDRSDNVSFAAKGVPAVSYGPGYTSMDEEMKKYYHQPADEPHTLNYEYLTKLYKSFIYAVYLVANKEGDIFWQPGDKYENAGKQLFGRK